MEAKCDVKENCNRWKTYDKAKDSILIEGWVPGNDQNKALKSRTFSVTPASFETDDKLLGPRKFRSVVPRLANF